MKTTLKKIKKTSSAKSETKPKEDGKISRKEYESELHKLQVELCHLQDWVKKQAKSKAQSHIPSTLADTIQENEEIQCQTTGPKQEKQLR